MSTPPTATVVNLLRARTVAPSHQLLNALYFAPS